jgi:hypothetical protein
LVLPDTHYLFQPGNVQTILGYIPKDKEEK